MKKIFFILFCLFIFYACQQQTEEYKQSNVIAVDTLNIERIKIKTH
jgi:uncharacterized lipoprotein YajG|tara:strand:+ start:422 stop:559 length:138 start_codon:yes stop_codon:yes gene_type:complete